jgi:hypothetical protein
VAERVKPHNEFGRGGDWWDGSRQWRGTAQAAVGRSKRLWQPTNLGASVLPGHRQLLLAALLHLSQLGEHAALPGLRLVLLPRGAQQPGLQGGNGLLRHIQRLRRQSRQGGQWVGWGPPAARLAGTGEL